MESITSSAFLDVIEISNSISQAIAEHLLGTKQMHKILLRYADLKANFDSVTYDECTDPSVQSIWKFSSGVTPYRDYDDTSNIPIPITCPSFVNEDKVISFDFPVWFNLKSSIRIMMLTQDPMPRSTEWYGECKDAICSTTFGIHNATWRKKGNGGKRMWNLIQRIIQNDIGVYLTDCKKFYILDKHSNRRVEETEEQLSAYKKILLRELDIIKPSLIVTFGNEAKKQLSQFVDVANFHVLHVPHFSGQAQGRIKDFFCWDSANTFTVNEQTEQYFKIINDSLLYD